MTVAFGLDNKALVVTTGEFIIFDPTVGTTNSASDHRAGRDAGDSSAAADVPAELHPGQRRGFGRRTDHRGDRRRHHQRHSWNTDTALRPTASSAVTYIASPAAGPASVSLSQDGTLSTFDWAVQDANLNVTAQFANPSGLLNLGSTLIDSSRNLIYAQIPSHGHDGDGAIRLRRFWSIVDSDNLTLEDRIQLPENLAGKSLLSGGQQHDVRDLRQRRDDSSDRQAWRSIRGCPPRSRTWCSAATSATAISRPRPSPSRIQAGAILRSRSRTTTSGITVSPSSGVTPANGVGIRRPQRILVQEGNGCGLPQHQFQRGGQPVLLPIRVLINSQDPSQRGTFVNVPGTVVDLLADPKRNVYYVLRQDKNQVLVYNGSNNTLTATLRTCTTPKGMAITFDQQNLLVGCDNAHDMSVFDLDLLTAQQPIYVADYVQSVAASANAILVHVRPIVSKNPGLGRVDMIARVVTQLPTLGVYQNSLPLDTVLVSPSNGANILIASVGRIGDAVRRECGYLHCLAQGFQCPERRLRGLELQSVRSRCKPAGCFARAQRPDSDQRPQIVRVLRS